MRLVIREYLGMLRESGELDALLPDLVTAMGLEPLSRPAIGPRQYGVDLPAVGVDPDDGREKLFLFTVKQGDITRNDWDTKKQDVRPSLNEILDSYLRTRVRPEHEALPKRIVLVTGGELRQDVEPDWTNYVHRESGPHRHYGEIEFDFWGGDRLSRLIERYLLDEYLFPESAQRQIRKTIALADQNEDEPRHFYALIEATLFERDLPRQDSAGAKRQRQRALRLLNLSLNIVFHWCREANNLRPALLSAERTLLRTWDWMRQGDLIVCRSTHQEFQRIFNTYVNVGRAYAEKFDQYCQVKDGLFGYGADEVEYPLRTFELLGTLAVITMALLYDAADQTDEAECDRLYSEAQAVARTLAAAVQNNPSASTPRFDGHIIDIVLGLLALTTTGHASDAAQWVQNVASRVVFAYQIGREFPVSSDSYEDLVALHVGEGPPKEELMKLSTLLPTLAEWFVVLGMAETYSDLREAITSVFSKTNLQMWFPDERSDGYLYRTNAGQKSGATLHSIQLPNELSELQERIVRVRDARLAFDALSCVAHGWPVLGLMASRHFRTPVIPAYWQDSIQRP